MELENLFNEQEMFFKVVARVNGDEFTEGFFNTFEEAKESAVAWFNKLTDYDKAREEYAVQSFNLENVIGCDCDLEDETDIDNAREYLVFSGYDEEIIK